jgi:KUP system potassium uptake protein
VSPVLLHHVNHNRVVHETLILMTFVADRRPRVPVAERHSIERLGHGVYRIQARLGFMQTPDIPAALKHCKTPGFEIDLDQVHYYIAHEIVVRRARKSGHGGGAVRDLRVLHSDCEPRPRFLQDSP